MGEEVNARMKGEYYVYVIELDRKVAEFSKFRKRNPDMRLNDPKCRCFYVGQTMLSPDKRFEQHKNGYKSGTYVRRYGRWLRRRIYTKYNPIPSRAMALRVEKELADKLRSKGHGVWSN